MALPTTFVPMGTTVVFGTSGFNAQLLGLNMDSIARTVRDVTNLSTTGSRKKEPGSLVDQGTLTMRLQFDPDAQPPIANAAETLTITFPTPAGKGIGAVLSGPGFVSEWSWDAQGGDEEPMTSELTWVWNGDTEPVWSGSSVSVS